MGNVSNYRNVLIKHTLSLLKLANEISLITAITLLDFLWKQHLKNNQFTPSIKNQKIFFFIFGILYFDARVYFDLIHR